MKKTILIFTVSLLCNYLSAQPSAFSWDSRHHGYNYISSAKDQIEQGPCSIFASVAAVEAMSQIYFNKNFTALNLSEKYLYNAGGKCPGLGCQTAGSISESLSKISSSGIIDESCFPYPTSKPCCLDDCESICEYPANVVTIPYYEQIYPSTNAQLQRAIMDHGPIVVNMVNVGCTLHPNSSPCNFNHSVLIIGWTTSNGIQWYIKDSWPGEQGFYYTNLDVINFTPTPTFYRVYPVYYNNPIECEGIDCTIFENRYYEDHDGDGFYNWGFDLSSKPAGCPGPDKMDFDDNDENHIFRIGTTVLVTPNLISPQEPICPSGGTFTLDSVPAGFSVQWSVSNAYCFSSSTSGNTNTTTLYPNSSCVGKQCKITFAISNNGTAYYEKNFFINGPRENQVSISVLDSYGGSPLKYGDTYYLCPNTTYMIYYNNYDYSCTTSDYDWVLPYGWTEYWRYNHYISINTNDNPSGFVEIWAKTCCSTQTRVKVYTQYFGEADCGGYFMAFPNPSDNYVDIDILKEKMIADEIRTDVECLLTIVDKSGTIKYKTEFKGFPFRIDTYKLPKGLYFINILYNGRKSSIRLVVEH